MMALRRLLTVLLVFSISGYAQGNSWSKVRYNGGTLQTKVKPDDWNNRLTVTSDEILLELKDKQQLKIPPGMVTGLSYGPEAHRRVGTMVALGILVSPLALLGLFHKTRRHYIGVEYTTSDGKKGGVLLQGHKNNYRAILMALRGATSAKVAVSEEDRRFVPTVVDTVVTKGALEQAEPSQKPGTIALTSSPESGEVYVDDAFIGNTPANLKLTPGKHTLKVVKTGHKAWTREVTINAGSEATVIAELEKQE